MLRRINRFSHVLSLSSFQLYIYTQNPHHLMSLSFYLYIIYIEDISMGNCLRHDNDLAGKEKDDLEPVKLWEEDKVSSSEEEESERSREGDSKVVRIKVVVTKEELRQILGHKKGINSIQHLVHVLKHSGRNISRAYEEDIKEEEELSDENWRPTLESIPENHY